MNRENDKQFFRAWDIGRGLNLMDVPSKPKELQEYYAAVEGFYDEYGYYPSDPYQDAIAKWNEKHGR